MNLPPSLEQLISAFKCLPSVGNKSAQRMAFHLLERDKVGGQRLSDAIQSALDKIGHCKSCRTFSESELCSICSDLQRGEEAQICVVETPADLLAIENTGQFQGRYFVLMGHLSPLDGIGPEDLGLDLLESHLDSGISELILATNPTVEGEATSYYIAEMAKLADVKVSRIAHGVPVGGELELVDGTTLSLSFSGRQTI